MIVIIGGTGLIGRALCKKLISEGAKVAVVTRDVDKARGEFSEAVEIVNFDVDSLSKIIDGAKAVINLAGESIAQGRWTRAKKRRIFESRINSAKILKSAIQKTKNKPIVVIQASATGVYGDRADEELTEISTPGAGFLAEVCKSWEHTNIDYAELGVNHKTLRFGVVLMPEGGFLKKLLPMFKFGLGAITGSGQNYVPWIHIDDLVNAILFLIEKPELTGVFNVTSPKSEKSIIMNRTIGKVLHRPVLLKIPGFILKLFLGQVARELILSSQNVSPVKLLEAGFQFAHPELEEALQNLLAK